MATYVLYAWPTVLLALLVGLSLGWLTWGRTRRIAVNAHRDAIRQLAFQHDRDLADRDATITILREELAAEAGEAARLRRLLGETRTVDRTVPSGSTTAPDAAPPNGRPRSAASVLALATARVAAGPERTADPAAPGELPGGRRSRRRAGRS